MLKQTLAAAVMSLAMLPPAPQPAYAQILQFSGAPTSAAPPAFTPAWRALKTGPGGQLNGISNVPNDGTVAPFTNTYGGYLFRDTGGNCAGADTGGWGTPNVGPCMEQVVTGNSITPTTALANSLSSGTYDQQLCPSNSDVAYMLWNSKAWVTSNFKAGVSRVWAQLPTITNSANGNAGPGTGASAHIACDPANPDIALIATTAATYRVTNGTSGGSAIVTTISAVTPGTSPNLVAFDLTSPTSGGASQHYWIGKPGTGVYETTTNGTPTLTSGGPTALYSMKADKFHRLWVADGTSTLKKYLNGSGWSASAATGVNNGNAFALGVNTFSGSQATQQLVASYFDGNPSFSSDDGASWTGTATQSVSVTGNEPGWMGVTNLQGGGAMYLSTVDFQYDASGNVWAAAGIGVWFLPSAQKAAGPTWQSRNIGIEQLVGVLVLSMPGNSPVTSFWDRAVFLNKNPDKYPSTLWPTYTSNAFGSVDQIQAGWAIDYLWNYAAPNVASGVYSAWIKSNIASNYAPAYTTDGARNWTTWGAVPAAINSGGAIAVTDTNKWTTIAGCNGCSGGPVTVPAYTSNSAGAYTNSTISSMSQPIVGTIDGRIPMAADRGTQGTVCIVDGGTGPAGSQKFHRSTNHGQTFTNLNNAGAVDGTPYVDQLISVPGQAGHFFYHAEMSVWKSTDACQTWTKPNSTISNVLSMGFGAPKPGNSYPTIYAYGTIGGVQALYESNDAGVTYATISAPTQAQRWPNNSIDYMRNMTGDMNFYGRIYAQYNGSGPTFLDHANACPWVAFSNINPNQTLTGTSVPITAEHSGLPGVTGVMFTLDINGAATQIGAIQTGQTSYTVNLNATANAGSHTLTVSAIGNGCNSYNQAYNSFTIGVTLN